ncbi:HEPN domain-containing protein [Nocardia suismassiliense]|uniref:HEPN domain-containing protein n=1 Tax=Nocardia suismassiliense TaxID=2077092 RepID=UPI00131EF0BF|nr:HEPN domain-containing protein [Nocardia suismassiliense]
MSTPALDALQTALSDVDRLLAHHPKATSGGRGRPSSDEGPLLRSSLVLIYAAWEVYVEDSAVWAVEEVARDVPDVAILPQSIKDFASKQKEVDPWDLAGDHWRTKVCELARLLVYGDPTRSQFGINTAGPGQVVDLHHRLLGTDLLSKCRWQKMSATRVKANLSDFISIRGEIAHKGSTPGALHLKGAQSWKNFVWRLAQALDSKIEDWVTNALP